MSSSDEMLSQFGPVGWDPRSTKQAVGTSLFSGSSSSEEQTPATKPATHVNNDQRRADEKGWDTDDYMLAIVLPTILGILVLVSMRHCYVVNRRQAQFHERRQNLRALERAQIREDRRLKEKKRKERLKEIEHALVSKVSVAGRLGCRMSRCLIDADADTYSSRVVFVDGVQVQMRRLPNYEEGA